MDDEPPRPDPLAALAATPVPMVVVGGARVRHVNAAMADLLGLRKEQAEALGTAELFRRLVDPADPGWDDLLEAARLERRVRPPPAISPRVRADGSREARRACLRLVPWPEPDQACFALIEADGKPVARRLTEALAWVAAELFGARDEAEVLRAVADALHWQGLQVAITRLEDGHFVPGPARPEHGDAASSGANRAASSQPTPPRLRRGGAPDLDEALAHGRARFSSRHAATLPARPPRIDVPLYVDGRPHGVLTVAGQQLTPAAVGVMDQFAQLVGRAVENVGRHDLAAERLRELSRVQGELVAQERLSALGEAAAVVAHEVRNPLAAISGALALLGRPDAGGHHAAAVAIVREEVARIETLMRDLVQLARPLELQRRRVDLGALVRQAVGRVWHPELFPGVTVEVVDGGQGLTVAADAGLLQLSLENLIRNALQASPPRGRVRVSVQGTPQRAVVAVDDQGPGVAPVDVARIFEPFYTTRPSGTGLGLSIVRRVVQVHGGAVHVGRSDAGGARFELVLPRT